MKTIIKDQVKAQVSKIMPKIKKYVTESLGAEVLVRSTNQPRTAYAVAASLSEFKQKKILIDKMEANKSINRLDNQKNLCNALVESYNSNKDIISSYGDVVLLKRGRDDQDNDEDPSARSDRGTKRRKYSKDTKSSKNLRPARRVILFGTILTTIPDTTPSVIPPTTHIDTTPIPTVSPTIPSSPDYTPTSPDYSPASDMEFDPFEDPSSDHIPPLPATSPFLSSTDDSSDSDIPNTPPSPTHGTSFTETTLSTQRSPTTSGALRRRVMVLAPGQPIPHDRPYRYHLNGSVHMMTARKRVGPMPTHCLAIRHSVDYSSSDHFSSDDSSRDSSSSSSSETSLDYTTDALSDFASSRSSFDHSLPTPSSGMRPSYHLCSLVRSIHRSFAAISNRPSHDSSSASPSRKRSRSPAASVPLSSPTLGALSYACVDLLLSPTRIRSPEIATDLEGCSEDKIDECNAYKDALRDRGIDARVVVEAINREEIETGMRGLVEVRVDRVTHPVVADDIPEPAQEGAVEVTYETLGDVVQRFHVHTEEILVHRVQVLESVQRDQGHRIVAIGQQSADMLERIGELERDNRRLRDIMDVESQRVTRF
ncbi:hypothetical protein Tco_0161831 [Tanacetum coccineum]